MNQMRDQLKMNLNYLQIKKINVTVTAEKVDEKNGATCLVIMFPSDLWSFNCPRVYLLQFCADLRSKPKYVNATYINAPESFFTFFEKMTWFIVVWTLVHEILAIKISKKMLTQQIFNKFLRLQTLNNTIFWNCVKRPFICIYVNWFNRPRFLAVSTKLQKMHFLDNLRTISQEENRDTRQMTQSTFSALTGFKNHFWIWKYSKFVFMWSSFWSLLVCKILQFLTKSYRFGQLIILF